MLLELRSFNSAPEWVLLYICFVVPYLEMIVIILLKYSLLADDARQQIHRLIAACRQTRAVLDKERDDLLAKTVTLSKVKF